MVRFGCVPAEYTITVWPCAIPILAVRLSYQGMLVWIVRYRINIPTNATMGTTGSDVHGIGMSARKTQLLPAWLTSRTNWVTLFTRFEDTTKAPAASNYEQHMSDHYSNI